jgi:hypothetical protein
MSRKNGERQESPMKRVLATITALGITVIVASQAMHFASSQATTTTLFDGTNLSAFNVLGDANWQVVDGVVQADKGTGYLVTKASYADFQINLEFWVDETANSGVFIRCSNPQQVNGNNSYEVNINDTRPDQTYRTGGIVNVARPSSVINTSGKWNTYEITARGPRMTVTLNGTRVVDVEHTMHARGPIALQYSAGVVKFRNVVIRTF